MSNFKRDLIRKIIPQGAAGDPLGLDQRLAELEARRSEVVRQIVALEKGRHTARPPTPIGDIDLKALQALGGTIETAPPEADGNTSLWHLLREREVIDKALEIGQKQSFRNRLLRAIEVAVERERWWNERQHRRAMLIRDLQAVNRECNAFRDEMLAISSVLPDLPAINWPRWELLGDGSIVGNDGYRFLQHLIQRGVVTPGELGDSRH